MNCKITWQLTIKDKFNVLLIEDILYFISTNLNAKQNIDLMIDYFNHMRDKAINQKDRDFEDNMLNDPNVNVLKAVYGYSLTCYKAQGGKCNDVFLYLDNKVHGIKKPDIYQWLCTVITRAKENLNLVND